MAANKMTLAQLNSRLDEIADEIEELQAIDFDKALRKAVVAGGDTQAIEEQEAKTERRLKHLRIEREALQENIPQARLAAVKPQLDEIAKAEARVADDGAKAAKAALKALTDLDKAMVDFKAASDGIYHDIRQQKGALMKETGMSDSELGLDFHEGIHHRELFERLVALNNNLEAMRFQAAPIDFMGKRAGLKKLVVK